MIKKISEIIVDILIQNGHTQYNRGVYVYGMECIISELIADLILFLYTIPQHNTIDAIIWLTAFLSIRIHIGGYHASNHTLCLLISTIISILGLKFSTILYNNLYLFIICHIFTTFYVLFSSPINSANHTLSYKKSKRERSKLLTNVIILNILIIISKNKNFSSLLLSGCFTATLMSVYSKLKLLLKKTS